MNITVYLGASFGANEQFKTDTEALGAYIGKRGHTLVYGGSKCGLMGSLAMSVMASGGQVIGVEPKFFVDGELQLDTIDRLIVTEDMQQRKAKMLELGDCFIAMPGGTGTLDEISEIMCEKSLDRLPGKPCVLYNFKGYYNPLKSLLGQMIDFGFSTKERQSGIIFADSLEEIYEIIEQIKA